MAKITTAMKHGNAAEAVHETTEMIPRNYYLWSGLGMLAGSVLLHYLKWHKSSRVLGQLASPILMMAMYNKKNG